MIDRTDFLNPVVKEKKYFEQKTIDIYVAAGLNKGIDVFVVFVQSDVLGVDCTCRVSLCDETIGVGLLSSTR
jgi:hypothetical protein